MELLLYRWSTAVQIASDLMIAGFFVALAASLRRRELVAWVHAWLANLGALTVTSLFWLLQPSSQLVFGAAIAGYMFFKSLFVVLLLQGARAFLPGAPAPLPRTIMIPLVAVGAAIAGASVQSIDQLGVLQSAVIAIALGWGGAHLALSGGRRYSWLATALALRALLAAAVSTAYATQWLGGPMADWSLLPIFIASHSSFDTGAEWVIALACVLTLYGAIQRELTDANQELRQTQEQLRDLLDRDQLTGVFNRRALPAILADAARAGATLLFVDLDRFKQVNDTFGHQVGDACLQRVARALQDSFASGDCVVRYAGDEFIVVARDHDAGGVQRALARTRAALCADGPHRPAIAFSVGMATLEPGGNADAALHGADEAMYGMKNAGRMRSTALGETY